MRLTIASFALALCSLAATARAQAVPQPGPEHEPLKKLVGTWDAVMNMQGQESPGVMTFKLICGGMWLESDYQGQVVGQKFSGHGLDGYDQAKKKYVSIWVDSMESAPMVSTGDMDSKTHTLTLVGEAAAPDGKPQKYKTISHLKDDDHLSFTMSMSAADGSETPVFTIKYTRRK